MTEHRSQRTLRRIGLGAFFLWAAFWAWFSLAEAFSDIAGGWSHLVLPLAPIALGIVLVIVRPRAGAWFLIAMGIVFALIFRAPFAWAALAAPPVVAGALMLLADRRPRTRNIGS